LLQAAMRAIETRRPLVRAGNTGISAVIHPSGFISQETKLMAVGAFPLKVPLPAPDDVETTLFVRRGHFLAPILAALAGLLAVIRLIRKNPD
ncbi:MAG: apolipoprotein N-acyltransferase, partial [Candidatus Adiutrix sp.]|nr:apolipoprotein N-acyltransferase [Candidatus Adiutrix sp.]